MPRDRDWSFRPALRRRAARHLLAPALLASWIVLGAALPGHAAAAAFFTETVQTGGFVGDDIAVAVDDRGTPHVAYWDLSNFFLMYATRIDGAWNTEIVEAAVFLGTGISIAVDTQRIPHIVFHKGSGGGGALRHASRAGGSWTAEDVDVTVANVGLYPAIAVDSQDRLHVSYYDATNGDLKYAQWSGTWTREIADGGLNRGLYSDIALDGSDRPHISYTDDNSELYYRTKIGSAWFGENIPGAANVVPTGIALQSNGTPVIASVNGGFLNVHTRSGSTWANVGGGSVTSGASYGGGLGIDAAGRIVLPFRDVASADLYFAEYDGAWAFGPLVQTGTLVDIGVESDLAIDPYGNPVVAYSDATNGDAMIADGGVRLSTSLSGATWPVGAQRTIAWKGAGTVDLLLSVNGGSSYQDLATGLTGGGSTAGGQVSITVPHAPSRFCKIKVRRTAPFSVTESESLFTIETSVSLLSLLAARVPDGAGAAVVSWSTDPGPADLSGYRLEKAAAGSWRTLVALTRQTEYTDDDAGAVARYRLLAVNGLGEELLLGETALAPLRPLSVWPSPYRGGVLTVSYATTAGWGGGATPTVVSIYDARGRLVRTLERGSFGAGFRSVAWDGRDAVGRPVAAGIYIAATRSGGAETAVKFAVLR